MEKILGLDLGTNSVGWAIREVNTELDNQIIDKGVLTFDKGVAEDKSGEHPMVQKRTQSRGKRRNYQAEKYRKWALLECLIDAGMCPLTIDELNEWRYYAKGIGRKYPQKKEFINWLRFDFDGDGKPDFERLGYSRHESLYLFRKLIVDESQAEIFSKEPHITGRVLYQLVQRRGYYDGPGMDEAENDELSKTIMKGGGESGAAGAEEIVPYLQQYGTLGAALYHYQQEKKGRIRKRYTLRSEYKKELEEICRVQNLKHLLHPLMSAIIWQRPLRGQKGLVGSCIYEKNKRRCPVSHPLYEEFRTWVFINNLKIKPADDGKPLENKAALSEVLHKTVYPQFFKAAPEFALSSIRDALKKAGYEIGAKFPEKTKVVSLSFLYRMKEIFGDNWAEITGWNKVILAAANKETGKHNIEDLWHLHFTKTDNKKTGEAAAEFLSRFAAEQLQLDSDKAIVFSKIRLQQGYATLSISAIRKILTYLHRGFIYSEAVYLANLPKVLGQKTISNEAVNDFSEAIRRLMQDAKNDSKSIQAVNELISDHLNASSRFGMDAAYELDTDDYNDIENKLRQVFGNSTWENMDADKKEAVRTLTAQKYLSFLRKRIHSKNVFEKNERLHNRIFNWLRDTYDVPEENIRHLWHPSEQETYSSARQYQKIIMNGREYFIEESKADNFLLRNPAAQAEPEKIELLGNPEPESKGLKNPMALKTLYKMRSLVNHLITSGKIDRDTRVVIEIARELNDANRRKAIQRWQNERERENTAYKKQIEEINRECGTDFNPEDKTLITKIRLWEEQCRTCMYTGKTIGLNEVLNGSKYDIEHTVPASMSFDNELKNLTLADKTYNQQVKAKKLPAECANYESSAVIDGKEYPSILSTIQLMFGRMSETSKKEKGKTIIVRSFERLTKLENLYEEWKIKKSDDKQIKDNIIIKRHLIKMELDYWRYKLLTFTAKEYKSGWRNSQLRDTQIITKYALPYLKTVFKKAEVQKGTVTDAFRKIYGIQPKFEKKDRTKHSHHATDAAVLTLIPPAAIRDKILLQYNEANESNRNFSDKPKNWKNFHPQHIKNIEDEVLINYQAQHRTLTPTCKTVRKRGKIQFITDKYGNKVPKQAKGDSIRGQLHKESFFGAIKNKGEIIMVERYPVSDFTSLNDCKNIVDEKVREIVQNELERRMLQGLSFEKAKIDPVPFPTGKAVIKKVRCRVAAGRGYLTPEKAVEIQRHTFLSQHPYKQHVYAQNDQNVYCLYYEQSFEANTERAFRIVGLFELAKLKLKKEGDLFHDTYYNKIETGKGKNKKDLPLSCILKVGTKVIFYKEHIEELYDLPKQELIKRHFRIYKFNEMGTPNLYLQNHLEARKNELLDDGDTAFNSSIYQYRLKIKADKFVAAIEGKHFIISPSGEIKWIN